MGFVFISYSRQDTKTVDHIVSRLQRDGFEVWIDRARIKGGDLWTVAIVEAIDTADSFLLMLSPGAIASENVRKEVQLAQDAKRRLFPLLIAVVTLPPQFRYQLAGIQMIDYAGSPETKYRELVEVLEAQRESMSGIERPETRQVEVVIPHEKLSSFHAGKVEKLLNFMAGVGGVPRAKLSLARLKSGSVHAIIHMPTHAAYVLKTAALNRDKRLLDFGIHALRLDGEENYIIVGTGEIGPLYVPKRRSSILKWLLAALLALAVLAAALMVALAGGLPIFERASPTPTMTIIPSMTNTLTLTASVTATQTTTLTPTATPTSTPTLAVILITKVGDNNPEPPPGILLPPPDTEKPPDPPPVEPKCYEDLICDPKTGECKKVIVCE